MLVKDQINIRMQQLQISHRDLADLCGTSDQTIRHWTTGRCYPSKRMAPILEQALAFQIDYGEGSAARGERVLDALEGGEMELLKKIQKLGPTARFHIEVLIELLAAPVVSAADHSQRARKTSSQAR